MALWSENRSSQPPDDARETEAAGQHRRGADSQQARGEWFDQQLSEQWQAVEPGIYRFVPADDTPGAAADHPLTRSSDAADAQPELSADRDGLPHRLTHRERQDE